MYKIKEEIKATVRTDDKGEKSISLFNLADFDGVNKKVKMFAHAHLEPGKDVAYHKHEGESEAYYILTGSGIYNDNGVETEILPGTVTLTTSGNSHGIKNTGDTMLEFIALILLD